MKSNPRTKGAALLMAALLCFLCVAAAHAEGGQTASSSETVIRRPDQSFTVGVYEYAAVDRMPGTVIRSFPRPANGVVGTDALSGDMCGYEAGRATLQLTEYDPIRHILYKTTVQVTVQARNRTLSWDYDSARRQTYQQHKDYWRVGETFQTGFICTRNGQPVKLTYASNMPEVAKVDQNGLVTMVSPGVAVITAQAEGSTDRQSQRFRVYEAKDGYTMTAEGNIVVYNESTGSMQVYERPDESSPVLTTMTSWLDESFSLLEKGDAFCKVLVHGRVGYVKTGQLSFTGQTGTEKAAAGEIAQTSAAPSPASGSLVVRTGNTGKLHLRAKASAGSHSLGLYANGTPVQGIDLGNGWAQVTVGGKSGYMMTKFLAAAPEKEEPTAEQPAAEEAKPEAPSADGSRPDDSQADRQQPAGKSSAATVRHPRGSFVNLRSSPGTKKGNILAPIPSDTQVEVLQWGAWWSRIRCNGMEGYMVTSYLK